MDGVVADGLFDDPVALRRRYAPPADPASEPAVMFPLRWYQCFLEEIERRGIVVLTYRDLFSESDDRSHEDFYRSEFRHWHARVRDPRRTYLLIQHDVDNHPLFTERMVAMEAVHGIRSNVFIFRDRYSAGDPDPPYPIDHDFFREAERHGFVIGYHQNAFQLAGFDLERAEERYRSDVAWLRERYERIEFTVPHGGRGREVDGRTIINCDVPMPPELRGNLRWVYNRYGATFTSRWSDGGLRRSRDPERMTRSDLVAFVRGLAPGTRNFCLVHPQRWGFHVDPQRNPLLAEQAWYREVCARYG